MFTTQSRIRADIKRWQAAGWITSDGAAQILADLQSRRSGLGLPHTLAILGAILIGLAAMSFVAANWQDMPKLLRLLTLTSGIAGCYAAANTMFNRKHDGFAHAAVLLGTALFGASIMLIAQMYHMEGNPPDAVWLWAGGAIAAGIMLRSNPALALAIVLVSLWSFMTTQLEQRSVHWGFIPMWALAAAGIAQTRWMRGSHLLALSLSAWLVISALQFSEANGKYIVLAIGLALSGTSIAFGSTIDRWRRISPTMLGYGMTIAFIALLVIQFIPRGLFYGKTTPHLWLWGSMTLAMIVGALMWAWRTENRTALWLAYTAFSIEIFGLYIAKLGTMLNTSAFFLITGLLVIALSAAAYRMHNAATTRTGTLP